MKPEGKLITCINCGETGVSAGGLRKTGEHYECNNRQKCEAILADKQARIKKQTEVDQAVAELMEANKQAEESGKRSILITKEA